VVTEALWDAVRRAEKLPPEEQDAIARVVRRELEEREKDEGRRRGLAALDRLAELREGLRRDGYPPVDAVKVARESREELERRPYL
jgi:hypothetical protein